MVDSIANTTVLVLDNLWVCKYYKYCIALYCIYLNQAVGPIKHKNTQSAHTQSYKHVKPSRDYQTSSFICFFLYWGWLNTARTGPVALILQFRCGPKLTTACNPRFISNRMSSTILSLLLTKATLLSLVTNVSWQNLVSAIYGSRTNALWRRC